MTSLPDLEHLNLVAFLQGAGLENFEEDAVYLNDIVDVFLTTMPPAIDELDDAIQQANLTEIKRIGHSLKGAMPTFGALRLGQLCEMLDDAAKHQDLRAVTRLLPQIRIEFEGVLGDMVRLREYSQKLL
ncbi:MAG: Hpt domain-containing protein [Verrucomicrobiota bacterium JB022]|nr:Hpt domain-containing protein [Verrucomicrobiota bacterium JB022]